MAVLAVAIGSLSMFFFKGKTEMAHCSEFFDQSCPILSRMNDVSHMIDRGELTAALDESLQIEEALKNQEKQKMIQPGSITRVLNRKRIAELYHALGLFQEESAEWQSLEELLVSASFVEREAQSLIEEGFKERSLDLKSYVATRKKEAQLKN